MSANSLSSSVALCTFNGARYLAEQIESILEQSVKPNEIVVFDDRSTDATLSLLQEFVDRAATPIRVTVNDYRKGSTGNFLAAIAACSSDIIFLSDQDDIWLPKKVETMLSIFASDDRIGLIVSDADAVDEELRPLGFSVLQSLPISARERHRIGRSEGSHLVLKRPFGTGSSMAFRANLKPPILTLDRPSELIHDTWILMVAAAFSRIEVIDEAFNLYRQHSAQQVGAPPKWRANQQKDAASEHATTPRASHRAQLDLYRKLRRALVENGRFAAQPPFTIALDGAIAHAQRRLTLPVSLTKRCWVVLQEFMSGRYSRFSSGWKSAGKDFLTPRD